GKVKFAMGCPNEEILALARPHVDSSPVDVETFVGKTNNLMASADFALVVSGTATLELAWFYTPMVVLYHVPQYRYKLVAHLFMHTSLYSLPNVLLGRRLVPEFITYWGPDEPIINEAVALLTDEERIKTAKQGFKEIRESLDVVGASERAAEEALGLIGTPVPSPSPWRPGFYV
ncbi:MAG: hypothetical protein QF662_03835, partial [Phycisphaerae bacterium]|nr:hypothetical protein [Phycisphaerae bacterium]